MTNVLTPNQQAMPSPDADYPGVPFTCLLRVEGLETSDGRMFDLGTSTWRTPPIPFMVQDTTPHGDGQVPEPAWAAGQINDIYRDPQDASRILGRGYLMPTADGQRAQELMQHAFRGVSTDSYGQLPGVPPVEEPTAVDQNGQPLAVLVRYNDDVIARATMVPTPAFEACCAWLDNEDMPQITMDAHGGQNLSAGPPDVVQVTDPYEALVASGGGPVAPPRSWFFTPEPDHYQPVEVSASGHLTGHLYKDGQCHIASVGRCLTGYPSMTMPPFKGFHRTVARCKDGSEVACGWIPLDTNHERVHIDDEAIVADHYENSGTLVAKVRASNGKFGTWLSGAALPGLSDRHAAIMQGLSVSGHWARFTDPETQKVFPGELLAILGGVPYPGLPETRTRPELLVASGQVVAQIGNLDPCDCDEEDPMNVEDREWIEGLFAGVEAENARLRDALVASGIIVPERAAEAQEGAQGASGLSLTIEPDANAFADGLAEGMEAEAATIVTAATEAALAAAQAQDEQRSFARYLAKYDTKALQALLKKGQAMPPLNDGGRPRFPIGDAEDLANAIRAVGRSKGDSAPVRRHIIKVAGKLGLSDKIPDSWDASTGELKSAA